MKNEKILIELILDHIEKIERYTKGISFNDFVENEEKYDACCLVLQQIWELAWKIKEKETIKNIPINQMKWLRNRITHDYLWLDSMIVWDTIKESLPELKTIIKTLISKL